MVVVVGAIPWASATEVAVVMLVHVGVTVRRGRRARCVSRRRARRTAVTVASTGKVGRERRRWRRWARGRRVRLELEARYGLLPQRSTPADGGAYAVDDIAVSTTHLGEGGDYVRHVIRELDGSTGVALYASVAASAVRRGRGCTGGADPWGAIAGVA